MVLDPVGAGASDLRNNALARLLGEVRFAAIKGNSAEIRFLAGSAVAARGVDAGDDTLVTEANLTASARMAAGLSARTGAVVVASGPHRPGGLPHCGLGRTQRQRAPDGHHRRGMHGRRRHGLLSGRRPGQSPGGLPLRHDNYGRSRRNSCGAICPR